MIDKDILFETGANMPSQYLDIVKQAKAVGWSVPGKLVVADRLYAGQALTWMNDHKIKLKPVPVIFHNPDWYLKERG